jgi:plastocyanin
MKLKLLLVPVLALAAGLAFSVATPGTQAGQIQPLMVGAGVGEGTVAGNVYAPGEFSVRVGTSVTWTITSDEPHTVTFGQGPEGLPPPAWPSTFDEEPEPLEPIDLGPVDHDADAFINTEVIFAGSTVTINFTEAGSYEFICVIHPGMAGVVNVVTAEDDVAPTMQEEADALAAETEALILGQVEPLRAATLAAVTSETLPDGTTRWSMATAGLNPPQDLPGGGTGYLEVMEFIPETLEISAGDTVHWTSPSPHTVTFLEEGQQWFEFDPFGTPVTKPAETYDGESFYHSGLMAPAGLLPPGFPQEFELIFPDEGEFGYVCLLHAPFGQDGTISVGPAEVAPPPVVPPVTGTGAGSSGTNVLVAVLLAFAGAGVVIALAGAARAYQRTR